jgi:hypothetical protein
MFLARKHLNYGQWLVRCENRKIHNQILFLYVVLYNLLSNQQCANSFYFSLSERTFHELKRLEEVGCSLVGQTLNIRLY